MRLQSRGFDGDSMGVEGSAHGVAGIDGIDGKKVSWGPTPSPRGERIEETARVIGGRRPRCVRGRPDDEKSFTFTATSR